MLLNQVYVISYASISKMWQCWAEQLNVNTAMRLRAANWSSKRKANIVLHLKMPDGK